MSREMILVLPQLVCMVLSFALLFRARRLAVGLWSTQPAFRRLPASSKVDQPTVIDRIFRP
jgi:hypothetical protein